MGKRLVGVGHLVSLILHAHRATGVVEGIHQLAGSSPRPTSPLSGDVYDLPGRRVLSGAASGRALQQLPHGIYIINGQKFQR